MDSDSQSDKPPQGNPQSNFSGFTNLVGLMIALVTLITPLIAIIIFSAPSTTSEPLASLPEASAHPGYLSNLFKSLD